MMTILPLPPSKSSLRSRVEERLKDAVNEQEKRLLKALLNALNGHFSDEEKQLMDAIELLRRSATQKKDVIFFPDFGAGPRLYRFLGIKPAAEKQIAVGQLCRQASKPSLWASILFALIRAQKPDHALELGTCLGISAAYQGAGLQLNHKGKLISLEGASAVADIARQHIDQLGLREQVDILTGKFTDTLPGILASGQRFDYVFIDGHHDEAATLHYFSRLKPALNSQALVVFDDIHWSGGMRRAWNAVKADKTVSFSLDLHQLGLCIYRPL